jgi:hypothetical protein
MDPVDTKIQSLGGHARRDSLTQEERTEISRRAALARFYPQATHEGEFRLADRTILAAVLPDGKRLIVQANFLRAIGRSRSPKAGTGVLKTMETGGLPLFLQAEQLQPYIDDSLRARARPVEFLDAQGNKAIGYDAELLPEVAEVHLKLRDDCLVAGKPLPKQITHIVDACDALMRGLARVGIIALIDEATGYQDERVRDALQKILDKYLGQAFGGWAKRFPDDFYKEIYRLKGWSWRGMNVNRPQVVAKYTNNIVYQRLAPGLLKKLQEVNPVDDKGRRKVRNHQWLTPDVGHPELDKHLHTSISFMRVSKNWTEFMDLLDRALPKQGDTLKLPL